MKYAIYGVIGLVVVYNVLTGGLGMDSLNISIPNVDGIWSSLGNLI